MSNDDEALRDIPQACDEGSFPEDVYYCLQMIKKAKTPGGMEKVRKLAPTPGSLALLEFAVENDKNRDTFFKHLLPRAQNRTTRDAVLKDDGRKRVEIFGPIRDRLIEEGKISGKCPTCRRALTKHVSVFQSTQKPDAEPDVSGRGS